MFRCITVFFVLSVTMIHTADIQSCNSDDMYTISYSNGSWECVSCTICSSGQIISQPCRYNSDTVCKQCPPDKFGPRGGSECKPCTICLPGFYVRRQCSDMEDRLCKQCSIGYFSDIENSLRCYRCGVCRHKEMVLRRCDGRNNTLCGLCDKNHYREASTLKCVPCSPCRDRSSVRVTECVRKLGKQSNTVCQLHHYIDKKGTSSTETTIVEDVRESTILDPLVITLPVVIIISVISSTLACLALLINLFKYRRKTPHPNLPESIDLNTDSIGLLETFELNVFTNSDSENNIRGAKVTEETVEVNDLRNRNENETEISGHMEPTLTEIPIRAPTHVLEITTSL